MGVEMPAGTSESPGVENKVLWTDSESKTVGEAFAFTKESGKYSAIELQSELGAAESAVAILRAKSKSQGLVTGVQALSGTSAANSYVQALASGEAPYVIKGDGKSDFLQLTETAKRKVNFGEATVEWPGGSQYSNEVEVSHGLGATPKSIQLTPMVYAIPGTVMSASSTKFVFRGFETQAASPPPKGTKVTFYWVAIG